MRNRWSIGVAALALLIVLESGGTSVQAQANEPAAAVRGAEGRAMRWKEVDALVNEQKLQEALRNVEVILSGARVAGDYGDWTKALIRSVQLQMGLNSFETAVRFMREQKWPDDKLASATLNLYYAHALLTYLDEYGWEIEQRARVDTKGVVDLKAWTRDQIYGEAQRALLAVWADRQELGDEPIDALGEHVRKNDFPPGIRDTLRDAATYFFVQLLANTALWRPEHGNELFLLDLGRLIAGRDIDVGGDAGLADPAVHPLLKIALLTGDLEQWHLQRGQLGGALEAVLERLRTLAGSFTAEEDKIAIRKALEKRLPDFRNDAWWAMGQSQVAQLLQAESTPWSLVAAREAAAAGAKAFPESVGGQRCAHLVEQLEAPSFEMLSMAVDGPEKRSLQITHRNLSRLYFRAYPRDLFARVHAAKDYNLLPQHNEIREILASTKPAAAWSVELPATPDLRPHHTYVTPPRLAPSYYILAASAREDFSEDKNRILAANAIVGDLVLVTRDNGGEPEILALSGATGKPLADTEISLMSFDWQRGHQVVERKRTDAGGLVRFDAGRTRTGNSFFVMGRHGTDVSIDPNYLWFHGQGAAAPYTDAFIYTDRSIYRPNQTIKWKVVAYEGTAQTGRYRTRPAADLEVSLWDANGQQVLAENVKTNALGSVSGSFAIPAGRLLGAWTLRTNSGGGAAYVRVEEYKRPTFLAEVDEPAAGLRLNREAMFSGKARYYFGLPVTTGKVDWRVTREPVYPWWWYWWRPAVSGNASQVVASGRSALTAEGTYSVTFTPQVDERLAADRDVTYRYSLAVDVTDEGGETASASRSFRLGFVTVEAGFSMDQAFLVQGESGKVKIRRSDLNGVGRAGAGSWKLVRLAEPQTATLPADVPREGQQRVAAAAAAPAPAAGGERPAFETAGDRLRPRWDSSVNVAALLRSWADGQTLASGELAHEAGGNATVDVPANLAAGAYRIAYETKDDFGATYTATWELIVAGRDGTNVALPLLFLAQRSAVPVGETARVLAFSGLREQPIAFDTYRDGKLLDRKWLQSGRDAALIEVPVTEADRGGWGFSVTALCDHQLMTLSQGVFVPWDNKQLDVSFSTFRDRLQPGEKETWSITVKGPRGAAVEAGATELLAYMYDQSLDVFAAHVPSAPLSLYPTRTGVGGIRGNVGVARLALQWEQNFSPPSRWADLQGDAVLVLDGRYTGGPGRRNRMARGDMMMAAPMAADGEGLAAAAESSLAEADQVGGGIAQREKKKEARKSEVPAPAESGAATPAAPPPAPEAPQIRTDFSETAFWEPHLLVNGNGQAQIQFTVPDSVTAWNVWVHGITRDLEAGSAHRETRSVKDLMVRPYLPRFFREGDRAALKLVVNNAATTPLSGELAFDIVDPESGQSVLAEFGVSAADSKKPFSVAAGKSTNLTVRVAVPSRVGAVAVKVVARAGQLSDGEQRPIPLLPGRMHLVQSRFAMLTDKERRELKFDDLARNDDPSRIDEQLVVSIDGQLFYGVLDALPYLVNFPYECVEQTLNRFVSTGIVSSVFDRFPAVAAMAKKLSARDTQLEAWDASDPNRKVALEETPWLAVSEGGRERDLAKILDPRIARAQREESLAKLAKAQTSLGAFPWWPGGPPSPYMTLYALHGFSKALEFGIEIPQDMVVRAWSYLHGHYLDELARRMQQDDCCWETITFLNYVLSAYPDATWTGGVFSEEDRKNMLDFSFRHWKQHTPYLKGYLTLTLKRMQRPADAKLVWDSVMDSAKHERDQGTFWAPEDRSWLWYADTIETHAFALRTLMELDAQDRRTDGLVQWLFLNKKLNHWKSTRATAEVIYSLVHYLQAKGQLGLREEAKVQSGQIGHTFVFEPDEYTGKGNQLVIPGPDIDPATSSTVTVEKETKGILFASATWHFSTEKLPEAAEGDFFRVSRAYFKRENRGGEWVLTPLGEGDPLAVGDEVEVHVSLRSKHAAEYVHLRDPRPAGMEPVTTVSGYRWDLGIFWYEETRDSGTNFFFEQLPVGEYPFKYRLRANLAGTFRVAPAQVQSMYAPEFAAYSAGNVVEIAAAAD
ncbi:MAG: hypothetical protein HYV63_14065 [Candidatus Schekmanbacteria bacterium]|nr:hypothetical protein [Candidatus Schekmanbacteria bacterium]